MITSHRAERAGENYGYFSRINPFLPAQRRRRRAVLRWRRLADSGNRAVVVSANQRGLQTALDLLAAGVDVVAVAEMRAADLAASDADLLDQLQAAGVRILPHTTVASAAPELRAASGRRSSTAVRRPPSITSVITWPATATSIRRLMSSG